MAESATKPPKTAFCAPDPFVVKGQQRVPAPTHKVSKKLENTDGLPVNEDYSSAINAVLDTMHPGFSSDRSAMESINSIMNHIFHKIATEAGKLVKRSGKKTLGTKDIKTAVKIVIGGGELTAHALFEGDRALDNYEESLRDDLSNTGD